MAGIARIGALLLALATAAAGLRAAAGTPRPEVDRIFAEWNRPDSPGCALGIYENGRIAYERGYGMASLEHDVPIGPETVFYVGSVSKQFTAMAAALAIHQGRLAVDDSIRRHLPELPEYTAPITVRHLVHHTSGLRDYNTLLSIAGRRGDEAYDNPTVLRVTARQRKLNFEPGSEYLYSNTGYTLLATIVERATGTPFAEYARQQIFEPLGMTVTHFHTDQSRLVKWRAFAYARSSGGYVLETPVNERAGAGGLFTSVRDLLHWEENFYSARVGGRTVIDHVQTPGALGNGTKLRYAWGLQIGTYRGLRIVEHSGSLGGYRAHLLRFPDRHVSLAALCNSGTIVPGTLLRQVADVTLGNGFMEPKASSSTPAAAEGGGARGRGPAPSGRTDSPADLSGAYYSDEVDAVFTVTARDGRLSLRRDSDAEAAELQPVDGGDFRCRGMTVRFERASDGRVTALTVDAGRVRDIRFVRR